MSQLTITRERAEALAAALRLFPNAFGGNVSSDALLEWVRLELGDAEALDDFRPRGTILSKAIAPKCILHVVAGNTQAAAIQSLTLGILAGAHNRVKLPSQSADVAEAVATFVAALPESLQALVAQSDTLSDAWMQEAAAVIVYGTDETVAQFRARVRPWQKFFAHGHRLSFAIVFDDAIAATAATARLAAADVCMFDQQGCLSVHDVYVREEAAGEARLFAEKLADAMAAFNEESPRRSISAGEAQEILHLRSSYAFRAANDDRVSIWESGQSTDWTVIYEEDPQFAVSCLNRLVFVKPLPPLESMSEHLRLVHSHLSSIAVWPNSAENARSAASLGASRVCALGSSQFPSPFWHQEGRSSLANLVDWIDLEGVNNVDPRT